LQRQRRPQGVAARGHSRCRPAPGATFVQDASRVSGDAAHVNAASATAVPQHVCSYNGRGRHGGERGRRMAPDTIDPCIPRSIWPQPFVARTSAPSNWSTCTSSASSDSTVSSTRSAIAPTTYARRRRSRPTQSRTLTRRRTLHRSKWVETMGLEPTTPCLQSRRSSQLSYVPGRHRHAIARRQRTDARSPGRAPPGSRVTVTPPCA
jgi:hypothetical protein